MKKILVIPPMRWYMEAHIEYLIRYLSDEFFIEIAQVPYPPYKDFLKNPVNSPLMRSPDDYDLLWPILPTHWGIQDYKKYASKVVLVLYEPGEGKWVEAKLIAGATPESQKTKLPNGKRTHKVRFGIDTELFKPFPMLREDKLLHVGVVGSYLNPRRQVKDGIIPLINIPGVRIMFFPQNWVNNGGDLKQVGGDRFLKRVVAGDKYWPGLPNIYNRLDVLLRIDNSYGYSFPTLEAAACGVPVIVTHQGIDHLITKAGGGILIEAEGGGRWPVDERGKVLPNKLKEAIIYLRDHPRIRKSMGRAGRAEIEKNWTWPKQIPAWRRFFREALK